MMGQKTVEPKLYMSFSLDGAVPVNHLVRRLAAVVDVGAPTEEALLSCLLPERDQHVNAVTRARGPYRGRLSPPARKGKPACKDGQAI